MIRKKWRLRGLALAVMAVGSWLGAPAAVHAAPGDWFEYTNEAGDNDLTNLLNWRWAHDSAAPDGPAQNWGHPSSQLQLETTRLFLSGAGSGMAFNAGNVYNFADVGNGKTFALNNAQLDGGATLDVHGTGVLTTTALSANGLGLNVVRDMPTGLGGDGWGNTLRYYRIPPAPANWNTAGLYGGAGLPSGDKNWLGNNQETTLHVFSGGTFTNTGSSDTGINSGIGPIGHMGYELDSTTGAIQVSVAGQYRMGGQAGNGTGGGFLTLEGYNAGTTITMGTLRINPVKAGIGISPYADAAAGMTGNYGLYGVSTGGSTDGTNLQGGGAGAGFYYPGGNYLVNTFGSTGVPLAYDSTTAQLRVLLTNQNTGGLFNSVTVSNLQIDSLADNANYNTLPEFVLSLGGYTPITGDLFSIVSATTFAGTGAFDVGWDTNFLLGGYTWQLHKDNPNLAGDQPGIYLEVILGEEAVSAPEPSTMMLGLVGLAGLGFVGWKRQRRKVA